MMDLLLTCMHVDLGLPMNSFRGTEHGLVVSTCCVQTQLSLGVARHGALPDETLRMSCQTWLCFTLRRLALQKGERPSMGRPWVFTCRFPFKPRNIADDALD